MRPTIKALIIDDESLSRDNISHALLKHPNWHVCGQFEQATHLLQAIEDLSPEVIFLDINMPGINGIQAALKVFKLPSPPLIVFVTAFDEYATTAFELMAIDYLLKPFNDERFNQTIQKAEYLLNDKFSVNKVRNWQLEQLNEKKGAYLDQLIIRSTGSIKFIKVTDINWIKASGNYTEIHHTGGIDLQRSTIKVIEAKLNPEQFIRVHRSAIVKSSIITEIKITDHNRLIIVLSNGDSVKVSAAYKNAVLNRMDV